jgi:hypothetical protein
MPNYQYLSRVTLFCATVAALCAASVQAANVSINPVADAFVDSSQPDNNYGALGKLAVAASGKPNGEFQSVMRFDVASTKTAFDAQFGVGQWTIQSITLQLTASAATDPFFNALAAGQFNLSWMQNDSWAEGTGTISAPTTDGITWSTLPSFLGAGDENLGTFSYNGASSGATTFTLTLTSGFLADVANGNLVSLRMLAADSSISYLPNSRSFGTTTSRPLLTINAVPEPNSLVLGLAGLSSLLIARRLRRR